MCALFRQHNGHYGRSRMPALTCLRVDIMLTCLAPPTITTLTCALHEEWNASNAGTRLRRAADGLTRRVAANPPRPPAMRAWSVVS